MLLYKALPHVFLSPHPIYTSTQTINNHEALRPRTPSHPLCRLIRAHSSTATSTAQCPLRLCSHKHARITEHPDRRRHRIRPRSVPALDHAERYMQVCVPYIYICVCMYADAPNSTREVVLQRDGTNVVQASNCAATSGTWFSPYDGATWTDAADVVCVFFFASGSSPAECCVVKLI